MQPWQKALSLGLEYSYGPLQADLHIDQLLSWYAQLGRDEPDGYTTELLERYGEHDLRVRFERCVDRIFLQGDGSDYQLFPPELAIGDAKIRYRKLMRVFHPDRGFNDEPWLNNKAENINTLYQQFNRLISSTEEPSNKAAEASPSEQPSPAQPAKGKRKLVLRFKPDFWRKYLGAPDILKQRITYGVAAGVIIVLILVLLAIALEQPARPPESPDVSKLTRSNLDVHESISAEDLYRVEPRETQQGPIKPKTSQMPASSPGADTSTADDPGHTITAPVREQDRNLQLSSRLIELKASSIKKNSTHDKPESGQGPLAATDSDEGSSVKMIEEETQTAIKPRLALARPSEVDTQVDRMLRLFKKHFVAGDEAALSQLYMTSARDNGNKGTAGIADFYHRLFENTSARDINISIDNMQHDGQLSARLNGYLNLEFLSDNNLLIGSRRFDMVIIKTSRGFKIAKFDWLQPH